MADSITWVGLDVHKDNIVAVAIGKGGTHQGRFEMTNSPKGKERLLARLAGFPKVRCAYEAGPTGYDLKRFLDGKGIDCDVIAPSLIPRRPGDRIKTDTKDAEKIARMHRMGELVSIHVPTPKQESMRDLLRAREDAHEDLVRKRHRLGKFLMRQGRRFEGKSWSHAHWLWIRALQFDDPNATAVFTEYVLAVDQEVERVARFDAQVAEMAKTPSVASMVSRLTALRGVQTLTAVTIVAELVDLKRFASPRDLMSFAGLVPGERSSGGKIRRTGITKTGNAHLRRVLVEAAWHYRHPPTKTGDAIRKRREGQPPAVLETARKAEIRLHKKFMRLVMKGKRPTVAATAAARELVGFVWAIGQC
jgi:transposase